MECQDEADVVRVRGSGISQYQSLLKEMETFGTKKQEGDAAGKWGTGGQPVSNRTEGNGAVNTNTPCRELMSALTMASTSIPVMSSLTTSSLVVMASFQHPL